MFRTLLNRVILSFCAVGGGVAPSLAQATVAAPVAPIVVSTVFMRRAFVAIVPRLDCSYKRGVKYNAVVRVHVDSAGKPGNEVVEATAGSSCLDEVALAAVQAAQFTPATNAEGRPVESTIDVPVALPFFPIMTEEQRAARRAMTPTPVFTPEVTSGKCKLKTSLVVSVKITVPTDGVPTDVHLDRTSGDTCFDQQAVKIAAAYRFTPAMKNGEPVATTLGIDINFQKF